MQTGWKVSDGRVLLGNVFGVTFLCFLSRNNHNAATTRLELECLALGGGGHRGIRRCRGITLPSFVSLTRAPGITKTASAAVL